MSSRYAIPIMLGSLALIVMVFFAGHLLLQACALPVFKRYLSYCPTPAEVATTENLELSMATGLSLQRRIFELERELSAKQCVLAPPDPTAPLTPEGWQNRDLAMLYGCWDLDTTYRTRDVDTGAIRSYAQWQMCFDQTGVGKQTMRSTDGIVCEGDVRAEFTDGGLSLIEPGNLACPGAGYIHQRQISCVPAPGGRARCETLQPETKGAATVGFERAPI